MRRASHSSCAGAIAVLLLLASANAQGKKRAASPYQISLALNTTNPNTITGRVMVVPAECVFAISTPIPMCDSDFTDAKADQICRNLGYNRGRKFFSPAVTFPSGTPPNYVAFDLNCGGGAGRRLRAGGVGAATKRRDLLGLDQWGEYEYFGPDLGGGPQPGIIATTAQATRCAIQVTRRCPSPFYYAGVECSDVPFKTAPPPMALPPSPPPPPPNKDAFISASSVEANLGVDPSLYGRFELITNQGWVPLCGFDTAAIPDFTAALAQHVCYMAYNWPAVKVEGGELNVRGYQSVTIGAPVPDATNFDPATKAYWGRATPSWPYKMARLIQDTTAPFFEVSSTPCTTLFAVYCEFTG